MIIEMVGLVFLGSPLFSFFFLWKLDRCRESDPLSNNTCKHTCTCSYMNWASTFYMLLFTHFVAVFRTRMDPAAPFIEGSKKIIAGSQLPGRPLHLLGREQSWWCHRADVCLPVCVLSSTVSVFRHKPSILNVELL